VIGKIKEAHTWSNRPIWPQGIDRPTGTQPVPSHVDWDLWLGVAPERPYVAEAYHPFNWRGWYDFGAGALGDMGCHIIDLVVWSLELGPPLKVRYDGPPPKPETFPTEETISYEFSGTPYTTEGPFSMKWYDGGRLPPHELSGLKSSEQIPRNGCLFVGEKGSILKAHEGGVRILPAERFADHRYEQVEGDDHYVQWCKALVGQGETTSHFDYAGPLTETVLVGVVASRVPGETLEWNSDQLKFANSQLANRFVREPYRSGWEVAGL
jgi:hypothetical protein